MNQVEHVKNTHTDPSIEAIYKKRAQYIENIYNKNLRPLIQDVSDQVEGDEQQQQQQRPDSSVTLPRPESKARITDSRQHIPTLEEERSVINREKTNMSVASTGLLDDLRENTFFNNSSYITDGGLKIYEETCRELQLVPCSNIAKALPTTIIQVHNYGLGSAGTLALSQALKMNLTVVKLDLSGNAIGYQGVKHLSRMFEENSTITDLNLSKNGIGSKGVKYLAELFKKNRFLRDLDLSKNEFTDDDGVLIADAVDDQGLVRFNISHNDFSEKAGIALGKWIADNSTLIEFDLSWNHLRKKGAIQIAKGLADNGKLLKLNLSWNGFENEGAEALGKALGHNMILQELNVKCNRIGPPGFAKLCGSLKDNTTLKRLFIGKNHINEEAVEAVMKLFTSLPQLALELLDISVMKLVKITTPGSHLNSIFKEVSLKPKVDDFIKKTKESHENFVCLHGFMNLGEKKLYNPSQEALNYINAYCTDNNISLMDLFAKLDSDGSMSVSYDEFKEGLRRARIPITPLQIDALIKYLDADGDGEIDFSELVIGDEQAKQNQGK